MLLTSQWNISARRRERKCCVVKLLEGEDRIDIIAPRSKSCRRPNIADIIGFVAVPLKLRRMGSEGDILKDKQELSNELT
jgi:hypothetical protein